MALTLRTLCGPRSLGLRLASPSADQDRLLAWVHSSELSDPTPYLDGDELLLTTGLGPASDPAGYVDRLAAHGLAGLGFGAGLGHDDLLPTLGEACARADLPLVEVPERTPFPALTKPVAGARAADRYAEVVRTDEAQRALTAAALGEDPDTGIARVLEQLTERLDAWAIVVGTDGRVRRSAPAGAARRAGPLRAPRSTGCASTRGRPASRSPTGTARSCCSRSA